MAFSIDDVKIMRFFKDDTNLRKIVFTLKGYDIQGGDGDKGYPRLDYLIHQRKLKVMRRVTDLGFADAAGAASYFMGTNTFSLGTEFRVTSDYGMAVLAHEGAHALIDLQNLGSIVRGVSEAIGYVAEAMWRANAKRGPIMMKGGTAVHPVRAKAFAIASALSTASNGIVPTNDADDLVKLIVQEKQYDDPSPHVSDGIG
ncbi:hypothetical protein J5Y09_04245 [Roseomonas sp. PWR1]|uniref:Uncharacterized protein n=1 Tax=Roseomonas nitratireducens TaxID=2820810 RepID=A0ABS4AP23_9PROT|nr:hypothetical protein [Neoroseomonas nitratireducens]MBP0463111.1 hypothetical protein [Neoroseomonas nitratireducens]